jgi:hypothetical protein
MKRLKVLLKRVLGLVFEPKNEKDDKPREECSVRKLTV